MDESEKRQIKMQCLNQAINLKQFQPSLKGYKDKEVVDIAKTLEKYVLGN